MRQCSKENPETFSVPCNQSYNSATTSRAPDRTRGRYLGTDTKFQKMWRLSAFWGAKRLLVQG